MIGNAHRLDVPSDNINHLTELLEKIGATASELIGKISAPQRSITIPMRNLTNKISVLQKEAVKALEYREIVGRTPTKNKENKATQTSPLIKGTGPKRPRSTDIDESPKKLSRKKHCTPAF